MVALLEGARDQENPGKVISNAPSVNQVNGTKRLDPYLLYLSVIKTLPLNSASAIGHLFLFCKTLPCHIYLKELRRTGALTKFFDWSIFDNFDLYA